MSSIFIKNVNIINPFSEEPLEERHVLIENGRIKIHKAPLHNKVIAGLYSE